MLRNVTGGLLFFVVAMTCQPGCSARSTDSSGPPSGACTPGLTESCACAGGSTGVRLCQNDRTFTACACAMTTDAATASDAPTLDALALDAPTLDAATPDVPVPDASPVDASLPDVPPADVPVDAAMMYPPGPYGSRVCARIAPFSLSKCDGTTWSFDQPDFFTSTATVLLIDAGWCVPCQMRANQIMRELVTPYSARGVRVVEVLVQNPDRTAITGAFCNTWAARYALTSPVLMDPSMMLASFYPSLAFPTAIVVDRNGLIRYRELGATTSLASLVAAINDTLASPDTCMP